MSETIQLFCQKDPEPNIESYSHRPLIVGGIALADGTVILGKEFASPIERTIDLDWPVETALRFADYYQDHFTEKSAHRPKPWNCHSFAASVTNQPMLWRADALPYNVETTSEADPRELESGKLYVTREGSKITHSLLGLPDPAENIAVWGYREQLKVTSNAMAQAKYGETFWNTKITQPSVFKHIFWRALGGGKHTLPNEDYETAIKVLRHTL